MALNLGTTALTALYLGSTAISTAYLGSVQVYDAGGAAFDPASLFASGEEGVWFEVSDSTAFSAVGTADTALPSIAAVGNSCGFLLDKSQGAGWDGSAFTGLGSEVVTGPTTPANWTPSNCTLSEVSGSLQLTMTAAVQYQIAARDLSLDTSKYYVVSIDWDNPSGLSVWVTFAGTLRTWGNATSGTAKFVLKGVSQFLQVGANFGSVGQTISFSNISVKEIPGNHAVQGTVLERPIVRQTGSVYYLEDDEVNDTLNWPAPADSDYTISYVNSSGTVTTLTGQSLSGATNILLDPALVAYVAVDRALTAGETTGLETYLGALA